MKRVKLLMKETRSTSSPFASAPNAPSLSLLHTLFSSPCELFASESTCVSPELCELPRGLRPLRAGGKTVHPLTGPNAFVGVNCLT